MEVHYEGNPVASLISIAVCVLIIVANWKIFEKAGEPGWKAIVPFYNIFTEFKIFWGNGWLFLLELVPIVNIVIIIMLNNKIAKAFGHGAGYTIGLIFLPYVFLPILGFGDDAFAGAQ